MTADQPATVTVALTDNGPLPLLGAKLNLALSTPSSWVVKPTSPTFFPVVGSGRTVRATYQVTAPQETQVFGAASVTMQDSYTWPGALSPHRDSATYTLASASPVQAPYQTYSSATDATAVYSQVGQQFGVQGAGPDLWTGSDAYSTIYQPGAVGTNSTIETEVTGQSDMTGYAKAGIIVRNSMTGSGTSPEGVILYESPQDGFQIGWDDNGGTVIDNQAPGINALPISLPAWLKLVRDGSTYTGYSSTDGSTWTLVGSVTAPAQNATQDAGMFVTSHATGQLGTVDFDGFSVG
jgi:alpha-galactosidase